MSVRSFYECDRGHQTVLLGAQRESNTVVKCSTCGADARLSLIVSQHSEPS